MLKSLACFLLVFVSCQAFAQLPYTETLFFARLKAGEVMPEKILSTRSVVFHPFTMTEKELEECQASFQRSGIDAVAYFESDFLSAGRDVSVALARYLNSREISNLVFLRKTESGYEVYITEYNQKANLTEPDQPTWHTESTALEEVLRRIYLTTANAGLKRENSLINDFPENIPAVNPIDGRRGEYFAADLKVDPLAVPKFGDEAMDRELEEIMKTYPFKYTLTEANLSESELRKQGYLFVLRFVHARAKIAKRLMGYDMSKLSSAIVSITYPEMEAQVKNIPVNTDVYKFYFKHIESGNAYLGTKWDADTTWQQALMNQLKGFKIELKVN